MNKDEVIDNKQKKEETKNTESQIKQNEFPIPLTQSSFTNDKVNDREDNDEVDNLRYNAGQNLICNIPRQQRLDSMGSPIVPEAKFSIDMPGISKQRLHEYLNEDLLKELDESPNIPNVNNGNIEVSPLNVKESGPNNPNNLFNFSLYPSSTNENSDKKLENGIIKTQEELNKINLFNNNYDKNRNTNCLNIENLMSTNKNINNINNIFNMNNNSNLNNIFNYENPTDMGIMNPNLNSLGNKESILNTYEEPFNPKNIAHFSSALNVNQPVYVPKQLRGMDLSQSEDKVAGSNNFINNNNNNNNNKLIFNKTSKNEKANQKNKFTGSNFQNNIKSFNNSQNSKKDKYKKPFEIRLGDWTCSECHNLNFSFRNKCNRCGLPKELSEQKKLAVIKDLSLNPNMNMDLNCFNNRNDINVNDINMINNGFKFFEN